MTNELYDGFVILRNRTSSSMANVTAKTEVGPLDGTPSKRMFWSIISDYDLKTGLCELIDNALDPWVGKKLEPGLVITLQLDANRQLISVTDNASGVKQENLRNLLAPGGSSNDPSSEVIGIFGVGSKRAGIALGELVQIRTRWGKAGTFQIDITKDWLDSDSWELAYYQVPDISPKTTEIVISHLRKSFGPDDVEALKAHLSETYGWFIAQGCTIKVNGDEIHERSFDHWAYPPGEQPRSATLTFDASQIYEINATITAGLIMDRDPEEENYGVYFYCNHRLIAKALRVREVGYFVTNEAGVPHPDASLCRTIVRLQGPAHAMPWNSSKNAINFDHEVFKHLRPTLIQLNSHYSSLSRRLKDDWNSKVFQFDKGSVDEVDVEDASVRHPLVLPALPRVNKPKVEKLKSRNKSQIQMQPWTLGLVESMAAVEVITRQRFETKNRIALMLLDSNFEIALKEFIVHRDDLFPPSKYNNAYIQNLFKVRANVVNEVTQHISLSKALITRVNHFYNIRNKLVHERATVEPTDNDIDSYRSTIESVLTSLFDLRF
jgi:hypothetical protein